MVLLYRGITLLPVGSFTCSAAGFRNGKLHAAAALRFLEVLPEHEIHLGDLCVYSRTEEKRYCDPYYASRLITKIILHFTNRK